MAVTTTNIIVGPAELFRAPVGTAEPTDPSADPGADWEDLGGTDDGVNLSVAQSWESHMCDQVADYVASSLTERSFRVSTQLVETTLENLQFALNGGTINTSAATSGSPGTKDFEPIVDLVENDPDYSALLVRGKSPAGFKRIFVVRRVLSLDDVEYAYQKAGKSMYSVTLTGHYVSQTTAPFKVLDKTAEPTG